jgi:hypothetical protein
MSAQAQMDVVAGGQLHILYGVESGPDAFAYFCRVSEFFVRNGGKP